MAKATDDRSTPAWVFDLLNAKFKFDLDVCATKDNAKCVIYFGPDAPPKQPRNALAPDLRWSEYGSSWWMNPPYSEIPLWLDKAWRELCLADDPCRCVCLLPVGTSAKWFQKHIWDGREKRFRERVGYVDFLPKRIDFAPHFTGAKWPNIVVELRVP